MQKTRHVDVLGFLALFLVGFTILWLLYNIIFVLFSEKQQRKYYQTTIGGSFVLYEEEKP